MQRELELKLDINARDAERLKHEPLLAWAPVSHKHELTVFFDTPKRKLKKAGFMFRIRHSGRSFVQTVKASGTGAGLFERSEWEWRVHSMDPDFTVLDQTPLGSILTARTRARLQPVARMQINRTTWLLDDGECLIEVTADQGFVAVDGTQAPVSELELELKLGSPRVLFRFADKLARRFALRLGVLSKADRAFALADDEPVKPVKAGKVKLRPDMSIADGLSEIALSCLKQFRLNEPLLVERRDAEALHQMRVAIRRLRSALHLFASVIKNDRDFRRVAKGMRSLGLRLGEARNLDVFIDGLGDAAADLAPLCHIRDEHYARIICGLDSPKIRRLMLRTVRWATVGGWREKKKARLPLGDFMRDRIEDAWALVTSSGESLVTLSEKDRHRVRIHVKKLRYALEFAGGLFKGVPDHRRRFSVAIEDLQEQLGYLNDLRVARLLVCEYCDDWVTEKLPDARKEAAILAKAERCFKRLLEIGPYWREPEPTPQPAVAVRRPASAAPPAASRTRAPRSAGVAPAPG
ncbi:CHAD domain-containing protein [Sphingomonas sp. HDW15A]|nr:CHAD domain-containing protein [Sphingomonas sp. HDW15A]